MNSFLGVSESLSPTAFLSRTPAAFRRAALSILLLALVSAPLCAATLDDKLDRVHTLWSQNKHKEIVDLISKLSPSKHIEDLRLFLWAESLRNLGREAESLQIYEQLVRTYPDRETAFRAGLQFFLRLARSSAVSELSKLEPMASSLATPYQRGRAFEELALRALDPRQKGSLAMNAIRQYRSKTYFYQQMAGSRNLITRILSDSANWSLKDTELIELMWLANNEDIGKVPSAKKAELARLLGKNGTLITEIIEADYQRRLKNQSRALSTLERIVTSPSTPREILGMALFARGEMFYHEKKYDLSFRDFKRALELNMGYFDVLKARYRMMRAAFYAGFDNESVKYAQEICEEFPSIPALPINLYDMGLERYDAGHAARAVPYLMLVARYFPGHHRADAALGFSARALGIHTPEGRNVIEILRNKYPHSFYLYWLEPDRRNVPLHYSSTKPTLDKQLQGRIKAWTILWNSGFASFAREEIRKHIDRNPDNLGVYKVAMQAAEKAGDYHQLTGYAKRLLRRLLDRGGSSKDMPLWAWKAHYPRPHWDLIVKESKTRGVDPYWVLSIMREESHFKPDTLSRSNAMGLMQILPSTGKWIAEKLQVRGTFNKNSLWEIDRNIRYGTWYLGYLLKRFKDDIYLASAAYNGGQGNVTRRVEQGPHANLPVLERLDKIPLPETRDYYKKVMRSYWNYKRLYR